MRRKQFLTILLVAFFLIAPFTLLIHFDVVEAQTNQYVDVYVSDGNTNASIANANVYLYYMTVSNNNFNFIASGTTSNNGWCNFTVSTAVGTFFRITVLATGYITYLLAPGSPGVNTVQLFPTLPTNYHNIFVSDYETLASLTVAVNDPTLLVQTGTDAYTLFGNIVIGAGGTLVISGDTFTMNPNVYLLTDQSIYNGVNVNGQLTIINSLITSPIRSGGTTSHITVNAGGTYTITGSTFQNLALQNGVYPDESLIIDTSTAGNTFSNNTIENGGTIGLYIDSGCANQVFQNLVINGVGSTGVLAFMSTNIVFDDCHDFTSLGNVQSSFAFYLYNCNGITIENSTDFTGYHETPRVPYTAWVGDYQSTNLDLENNSYITGFDFGVVSYDSQGITMNANHDWTNLGDGYRAAFMFYNSNVNFTNNYNFYNMDYGADFDNVTNGVISGNYNFYDITYNALGAEDGASNIIVNGNYNLYDTSIAIVLDCTPNSQVINNYNIHDNPRGGIRIVDGFVTGYYFGWPPTEAKQVYGLPAPQPTTDVLTQHGILVQNNNVSNSGVDTANPTNDTGPPGGIIVWGVWGYPYNITVQGNVATNCSNSFIVQDENWLALMGGYGDPPSNVTFTNNTVVSPRNSTYYVSNWENTVFHNIPINNLVTVEDAVANQLNFTFSTAALTGVGNLTSTPTGGTFAFSSLSTSPTLTLTTNIATGYVLSFFINGVFQGYTGLTTTLTSGTNVTWIYTTIPTPTPTPVPTLPPIIITGNTQAQFYLRSDQYNTFNVQGYGLDSSYTNTPQTITETYFGNDTVTYGANILLYSSPTINNSVSGGIIPLFNVQGNTTGEETANYNFPGAPITLGYQALQIQLYQQYNGGSWQSIANFVSPTLVTSQVQSTTWTFALYVNNTQTNGANGYTYASVNFGNKDYPSSISNIVFKKSPTSDIAMWMYNRADYVGLILLELTTPLGGSGFYALILLGFSGSLYYRYKNVGVIVYFIITMISGGFIFYILPIWAATVAAALVLLGLTFIFWRLIR